MIWPAELAAPVHETQFNTHGGVRVHRLVERVRKPAWLVLLKLITLVAMLPVGYYLVMSFVPLPIWQSAAIATGVLLAYILVAHFIRPEPNMDNMGWGGSMCNDPGQGNDNINRILWKAHCFLGPGRFASGAVIDFLTLVGILPEVSYEEVMALRAQRAEERRQSREQEILARVEKHRKPTGFVAGSQELASARFLQREEE